MKLDRISARFLCRLIAAASMLIAIIPAAHAEMVLSQVVVVEEAA